MEFDVQLSKDMVPVIYHDFHVCISLKRKKMNVEDMLEIPLKDLTLEQLQCLQVIFSNLFYFMLVFIICQMDSPL